MITFFHVVKNYTGTFNSIGIVRCISLQCRVPFVEIVAVAEEPSVENSWLTPHFLYYDPAVVYTRTNNSLEYLRCQDYICSNPVVHEFLDDALPFNEPIITQLKVQPYIITNVVAVQLFIVCVWLSSKGSKQADFISRYITTPFLSK